MEGKEMTYLVWVDYGKNSFATLDSVWLTPSNAEYMVHMLRQETGLLVIIESREVSSPRRRN